MWPLLIEFFCSLSRRVVIKQMHELAGEKKNTVSPMAKALLANTGTHVVTVLLMPMKSTALQLTVFYI